MMYDSSYSQGWDCDPTAEVVVDPYDLGLDEEADETDWQVLVLDRFADRSVNPGLRTLMDVHYPTDPTDAAYREELVAEAERGI